MKTNVLYYSDNLSILRHRDYFPDECVDLIYLDSPFNSKADYSPDHKPQHHTVILRPSFEGRRISRLLGRETLRLRLRVTF